MKRVLFFALLSALVLSACSTMAPRIPGVSVSSPITVKPVAAIAGTVDFRDGEVLCSSGSDAYRETFHVARIVSRPTAATKNQAEVVYLRDGKKEWVNFIMPSKKSAKQDLAVGKVVFYPTWHKNDKDVTDEEYRKNPWRLGRVSSVDELFKDIVEVSGNKYYWQVLRTPDMEP